MNYNACICSMSFVWQQDWIKIMSHQTASTQRAKGKNVHSSSKPVKDKIYSVLPKHRNTNLARPDFLVILASISIFSVVFLSLLASFWSEIGQNYLKCQEPKS